uniref:Uncharacterized protein n=1 Tax=Arundo donax TaxID=35708 RepID=A0A0A9CCB2_ARUDO
MDLPAFRCSHVVEFVPRRKHKLWAVLKVPIWRLSLQVRTTPF